MTDIGHRMLCDLLMFHEGFSNKPYLDTVGKLTIGYGRNLNDRGITEKEARYMLDEDIAYFEKCLIEKLDFFTELSEPRQLVLLSMCYNLGIKGFFTFKNFLKALDNADYETASDEMLKSKWANQVGQRAIDLATIMRTGEL